jgi:Ankyrin repeats (3 copies)
MNLWCKKLLDWNANFNLKDDHGDDALMGAALAYCFAPSTRKAQAEIMKLLIARGVDPNSANNLGLTPLMLVSSFGNEEATRALIHAGAAVDARDVSGKTPLDHARDMLKKHKDSWWVDELQQIVYLLEENQNRLRPLPPSTD